MATVNIKYYKPKAEDPAVEVAQISPLYDFDDSYVDNAAVAVDRTEEPFTDVIPAANKFGFEGLDMKVGNKIGLPYPNGVGMLDMDKLGEDKGDYLEYEFEVTDEKEVMFYQDRAKEYTKEETGFVITVTPAA